MNWRSCRFGEPTTIGAIARCKTDGWSSAAGRLAMAGVMIVVLFWVLLPGSMGETLKYSSYEIYAREVQIEIEVCPGPFLIG